MSIESEIQKKLSMAQEVLLLAYIAETGLTMKDIEVKTNPLAEDGLGFSIHVERKLI